MERGVVQKEKTVERGEEMLKARVEGLNVRSDGDGEKWD